MIHDPDRATHRYRSIWISDVHLGARSSRPDYLLDFLRHHDSEFLYLTGDIIDGWRLKKSWLWNQPHNDVIQKILRRARKGTEVFYIPGNHDQFARDYVGMQFGGIRVCRQAIHRTADDRRLLIIHGDEFDGVMTHARWLAVLGSRAYEASVTINRWLNHIRLRLGMDYWSFSAAAKHQVKNVVMFIDNFETNVTDYCRRQGLDGVVCGHIHRAAIKNIDDIAYYNTGDWVESFTALVEHHDGRMELIHWMHNSPPAGRPKPPRTRARGSVPIDQPLAAIT
ncbi:MAG: UDP-2,3-diacylglucosamine diphosphatase [Verrucomicrobia bacterium]|nr:UDP-2,3-diacylglucosamine diphosphatase [Verrucomicrobiota bacterium]